MQSVRNMIAVIFSVAGLFVLALGIARILHETYLVVGAILLVGGLALAGLYAIADKLGRMESQAGPGSSPSSRP